MGDDQRGPASMRFAVLDLETSGLRIGRHHILQMAVVVIDVDTSTWAGTEIDRWSTMVALHRPWARLGPRRVHGIRRRHLRGAPGICDALDELGQRIDGALLTAHNVRFDAGFLDQAAARCGRPVELGPRLCTLRLSRALDPERRRSHRLADLCTHYGIRLERAHDALEDAVATASLLPHLLAAHRVTSPDQLTPFLEPARPPLGADTSTPTPRQVSS